MRPFLGLYAGPKKNWPGKGWPKDIMKIYKIQVKEATDQVMRMQKELLQAERLAATGETVAGLAHAIKNILSGLKGGRYMVNQGFERNEMKYLKDGWDMVERNIEKISGLTKDLLNFCREREPEREPVNPNDLIREIFDLFQCPMPTARGSTDP